MHKKQSEALKICDGALLEHPDIVGVGRTRRTINIYAMKELSMAELKKSRAIDGMIEIYPFGVRKEQIKINVRKVGRIIPYRRIRPAKGGVSIGHYKGSTGTFGCLVRDANTGEVFILSSNHVLADINRAAQGDLILQPGPADGGTREDKIATFERAVPIDFENHNLVDAAIAKPISIADVDYDIIGIGIPTSVISRVRRGMKVQKVGAVTNHTIGEVEDIGVSIKVEYDQGTAIFRNQIITTPMARPGDSGSLLLSPRSKACGLLLGGPDNGIITVYNYINDVLRELGVEL